MIQPRCPRPTANVSFRARRRPVWRGGPPSFPPATVDIIGQSCCCASSLLLFHPVPAASCSRLAACAAQSSSFWHCHLSRAFVRPPIPGLCSFLSLVPASKPPIVAVVGVDVVVGRLVFQRRSYPSASATHLIARVQ